MIQLSLFEKIDVSLPSQENSSPVKYTTLQPILKWTGGKEKELKYIKAFSPRSYENYYEPFVGGGSVFAAIDAKHLFINDKSDELICLYKSIACQDELFFKYIEEIIVSWDNLLQYVSENKMLCQWYKDYADGVLTEERLLILLNEFIQSNWERINGLISSVINWNRDIFKKELFKTFPRKFIRMKVLDERRGNMTNDDIYNNIETIIMGSFYMYMRGLYNDRSLMNSNKSLSTAVFLFIRNFAYSGMFRYNKNGDFNVPYGGIAYNHKDMRKKIQYYKSKELLEHFSKTKIENLDFEDFFHLHVPGKDDFIFLDPPYDSEFSTYAQNEFGRNEQIRLANYLCNECKAKWQMIIKYTPFIYELYNKPGLFIHKFDKTYQVSFMNRNDKDVEHLIIMNYSIE